MALFASSAYTCCPLHVENEGNGCVFVHLQGSQQRPHRARRGLGVHLGAQQTHSLPEEENQALRGAF